MKTRRAYIPRFPRYRRFSQTKELFRESFEFTLQTTAGGVYPGYVLPVMNNLAQIASYTALYSEYKVLSFDVQYIPFFFPGANAAGFIDNTMYTAFTPNGNSAPGATDLLSYKTLRTTNVSKPWRRRIYPHVFQNLDDVGYGTKPSKYVWIDSGNDAVVFHGLLIYVNNIGLNTTNFGKIVCTINFICRNQI